MNLLPKTSATCTPLTATAPDSVICATGDGLQEQHALRVGFLDVAIGARAARRTRGEHGDDHAGANQTPEDLETRWRRCVRSGSGCFVGRFGRHGILHR